TYSARRLTACAAQTHSSSTCLRKDRAMMPTPSNRRRPASLGAQMLPILFLAFLPLPGPAQQAGMPGEDLADRFCDVQPPTVIKDALTLLRNPAPVVQPLDEAILATAFSPDGRSLVTAGGWWRRPGQILIWDVATRKVLRAQKGIRGIRAI